MCSGPSPGGGEHLLRPAAPGDVQATGSPRRPTSRPRTPRSSDSAGSPWAAAPWRPARRPRARARPPQELRRGETGIARLPVIRRESGARASRLAHSASARPSFHKMAGRSTPAPRIEEGRAVHLAGEADRPHRGECAAVFGLEAVHRAAGGGPPVPRILLRPPGARGRDVERSRRLGRDPVVPVQQHRLDAGGAEIDAEIHLSSSPFLSRPPPRLGSHRPPPAAALPLLPAAAAAVTRGAINAPPGFALLFSGAHPSRSELSIRAGPPGSAKTGYGNRSRIDWSAPTRVGRFDGAGDGENRAGGGDHRPPRRRAALGRRGGRPCTGSTAGGRRSAASIGRRARGASGMRRR